MKKPRLFYWEEGVDAWCPVIRDEVEGIVSVDSFTESGETMEIRFKRIDMTDEEFAAIPEE